MSEQPLHEALPATPGDVAARIRRHSWRGHLTLENIGAVADRIDRILVGRYHAFAMQHEHDRGAYRPALRTGLRVDGPGIRRLLTWPDGRRMGTVSWADGYYWAISTEIKTARDADEIVRRFRDVAAVAPLGDSALAAARYAYWRLTEVAFDGDKITIESFNIAGERLTWTVQREDHTDYETYVEETEEPVTGAPIDSVKLRVGPLEGEGYEGRYGAQATVHVGPFSDVNAWADPDEMEAYARRLSAAARQVRARNARVAGASAPARTFP